MSFHGRTSRGRGGYEDDNYDRGRYDQRGAGYQGTDAYPPDAKGFRGPPPDFPPYGHGYGQGDYYPRHDIPPPIPSMSLPPPPIPVSAPPYITSGPPPQSYGVGQHMSDRLGPPVDYMPSRGQYEDAYAGEPSSSRTGDRSYTSKASSESQYKDYGHGNEPSKTQSYRDSPSGRGSKPHDGPDYRSSHHESERKGGSASQTPTINIDALLQDERLKNVLFAGISKATAKLEQSLAERNERTSENVGFFDGQPTKVPQQLFPAAQSGNSQKPKSILKRKGGNDDDDNSNDSFSKLSALEKTLQLLRGKSNLADAFSTTEKKSSQNSKQSDQPKGALGQLASYDDGADDNDLYDTKKESLSQKQSVNVNHPFWSFPPEAETVKRETDTFDIQDKLYEKWRQTINKSSEGQGTPKSEQTSTHDPFFKDKIPAHMVESASQALQKVAGKDTEELDSTVQNILQSIGFNFDLSKRMQELARQKKKVRDELQTGIVDQSASFLDQHHNFGENVKASLFSNDQEQASIESLIREARASSQKNKLASDRRESPPSRGEASDRSSRERVYGKDRSGRSPERNRDMRRLSPDDRNRSSLERKKEKNQWEKISPERDFNKMNFRQRGERDRSSYDREDERKSKSYSRDRNSPSPPRNRSQNNPRWSSHKKLSDHFCSSQFDEGSHRSERFMDDPKDEYFYPEDSEYKESLPAVPLLTSFSSRKKEEDLSSGLFPSAKLMSQRNQGVENLRVMSRNVNDDDDDSFTETRRIILPAKSERRVVSRSPPFRDSRSPIKLSRKRSASPMTATMSKERKLYIDGNSVSQQRDKEFYVKDRKEGYFDKDRLSSPLRRSPFRGESPGMRQSPSRHSSERQTSSYYLSSPYGRSQGRDRDFSPPYQMTQDTVPLHLNPPDASRISDGRKQSLDRKRTPERGGFYEKDFRKKSPGRIRVERRKSTERRRSKSPERRRSRSPVRHRSRSTDRRRSKSPGYRRSRSRSPGWHRRSPKRTSKRSPMRKRSPGRRKSPDRKRASEKDRRSDRFEPSKDQKEKNSQPKVDVSKLAPEERKAYLQKMLEEKGQTVDQAKSSLLAAFEKITKVTVEERKELLVKMGELSQQDKQIMMDKLTARQDSIKALKIELGKLKREQNELMRKSQRSGLGIKDPELIKNTESQDMVEKKIMKLSLITFESALDAVPSSPPPPTIPAKFDPKTVKPAIMKRADIMKSGVSDDVQSSKTEKIPTSTTSASLDLKVDTKKIDSGQVNWKSVVPPETSSLPDVDGSVKKEKSKDKDKKSESKDHSTTSQSFGKQKVYYEYYDSFNHWCKHCGIPCNSLDQLFHHCHGKKHMTKIENSEKPWKAGKKEQKLPSRRVGMAQGRRIKGSEMMFPVAGFYCTLCKVFCGDFSDSTDHLKSDSHYDKYMDFIKVNPMYEKKLLLEKTKSGRNRADRRESSPPPPPPPPPPSISKDKKSSEDSSSKTKSAKKNLRVTGTGGDTDPEESNLKDNTDVVDMELDNDEEGATEMKTKVPKLTGKTSVLPALTSLMTPTSEANMKETKEDEVQPLDTFLTINQTSKDKKKSKLPVVGAADFDLMNIPIPQGPSLQGKTSGTPPDAAPTVKTLKEVQNEKQKAINEEKRMMGIDVDAEVEQPLEAIPVPPPNLADLRKSTENPNTSAEPKNDEDAKKAKPKSLDSLFFKLSKRKVGLKPKPKAASSLPTAGGVINQDIDEKFQAEIKAKLEKEKQKILRKQQRKEEKPKRLEEQSYKKTIQSDSDYTSDESEESDEEAENVHIGERTEAGVSVSDKAINRQAESLLVAQEIIESLIVAVAGESATVTEEIEIVTEDNETVTGDNETVHGENKNLHCDIVDLQPDENKGEEMVNAVETTVPSNEISGNETTMVPLNTSKPKDQSSTQEEEITQLSLRAKAKGKPKGKARVIKGKTTPSKSVDVSDLSAFFAHPEVSIAKHAPVQKKPGSKATVKKAGTTKGKGTQPDRRCTRRSKKTEIQEDFDGEDSEDMMFGEGLIVLSEYTEDDQDEQGESTLKAQNDVVDQETVENFGREEVVFEMKEKAIDNETYGAENADSEKKETILDSVTVAEEKASPRAELPLEQEEPNFKDVEDSEVKPPSRGRGRRGGRGKGRGRKAKSSSGTGDSSLDVREHFVTIDEITPVEKQMVDSESEEAVDDGSTSISVRQTRNRRGGTAKRGRGRGRQTRSRTKKEENDIHNEGDSTLLSDGFENSLYDDSFTNTTVSAGDIQPLTDKIEPSETTNADLQDNVKSENTTVETQFLSDQSITETSSFDATAQSAEDVSKKAGDSDGLEPPFFDVLRTENISEPQYEALAKSLEILTVPEARVGGICNSSTESMSFQRTMILPQDIIGDKGEGQHPSEVVSDEMPCLVPEGTEEEEDSGPPDLFLQEAPIEDDSDATITEETEPLVPAPDSDLEKVIDEKDDTQHSMVDLREETTDGALEPQPNQILSPLIGDDGDTIPDATYSDMTGQSDSCADAIDDETASVDVPTPSSQGRDPPMSGVVSELEEPMDSFMVQVNEEAEEEPEAEILPSEGLSLGLEEDEDSMEFDIGGMDEKLDSMDD